MDATSARSAVSAADPAAAAAEAFGRLALIRAVEERLLALFTEGKLFGTTHTCLGQEACAYAVVGALDTSRDLVFSTHRCHGHYLMWCDDAEGLIAEIMGRATGTCGGRGGSQHLCRDGFHSNGVQGGIAPVTVGMAMAEKRKGTGGVACVFLGDGTLGEGAIYEALNLASLWRLPVLFVLEHNQWAQSTPTALTIAGDVAARAAAFGIPVDRRLAHDPLALRSHMASVVEGIRRESRPFFQILDTYRLGPHSKGDDHRTAEEMAPHRAADPYAVLRAGIGAAQAEAIEAAARARVERAVEAAEAAPFAALHADEVARLHRDRGTGGEAPVLAVEGQKTVVQRLNEALHEVMDRRPDVVVLGEDILDPYGGAFKVTRGLSTRFPERVCATPISESAIVGLSGGLALRGQRPVAEIMFGDFITLGADQIVNHLAKFHWMYAGQVEVPVVIRTPVGGRRGYGPTHSQCIEKMFLGVPGLVTVAVSLRHDPGVLLAHAIDDDRPVLFIEQKMLYGKRLRPDAPAGLAAQPAAAGERYPAASFRPVDGSADLTIVTYGGMTDIVEEAMGRLFDEDEVLVEYVVVAQLAPLDAGEITTAARRTGRLLVVEEGTEPWGFGAEVVARVAEATGGAVRCGRVGALHLPIPNARPMEEAMLPDVERVVAAARRLLSGTVA